MENIYKVIPRRLCVDVSPFLIWRTLTLAVSPIIEDEYAETKTMEYSDRIETVRDIPRISMAEEYETTCIICRDVPRGDIQSIPCPQCEFPIIKADIARGGFYIP